MPLVPSLLSQSLLSQWLPRDENGPFPDDAAASARALAGAIADWFGQAMAAGMPCSTAAARKSQLEAQLIPALQAGDAMASGQQVALAFMAYVAGQSFGHGIAAPPVATPAAGAAIGAAFGDKDAAQSARADRIAQALHAQALSAIVTFAPPPPPPAPIT
jgi:hypothetical protein